MKNELNHNHTLAKLNSEVKYSKLNRQNNMRSQKSAATKAYNKAVRKASKAQLSRYLRKAIKD